MLQAREKGMRELERDVAAELLACQLGVAVNVGLEHAILGEVQPPCPAIDTVTLPSNQDPRTQSADVLIAE